VEALYELPDRVSGGVPMKDELFGRKKYQKYDRTWSTSVVRPYFKGFGGH
jgi:hypothetical protein